MSSKEKEGSVTSNDGEDKKIKEELQDQEDLQVLDEVHENDDGTGYGDEDILEGDEHIGDEEADYLEAEDDLGEEELADDDLAEEGDDELHEELADEANTSATDGEKPAGESTAADGEGEGEGKEDAAKAKKEGEQKTEDKDNEEEEDDDSIPRCPFGHKLREDTNSNRFGCTANDCHRKNDPNIIDARRSTRDGREYRERLFLPNYKSFKIDLKIAAKVRSVIAGPLDLEDLQDDKVREIINQAEEFFIRFHRTEDNKCTGHVQFRFATFEEATASVEKIEKIKEGLTVKQLVGGLNVDKFTKQMTAKESAEGPNVGRVDKLIRGVDDDIDVPADTVKNLVSVCGIPTTTTKEQLAELFPQARIKLMAMKANGTPKGYCYVELDDEEAAKKLVEEHNAKPHVLDGHKLYLEKMQAPLELFMVIDSDDVLTEEERAKIVRTLNMSQMQLDRRGSRMKTKEYHDMIRKVRMMKQKLAIDNRKRREKGMSLPKPPMRRPMGASSRPMYPMSRPRGMGPRPSRPDMRPRRDAMSPRSSVRSPVSRNRPTYRVDERYHSGHGLRSPSPRGEGHYGQSPSSRRDLGPPRRMDSDRGGRFGSSDRGRFSSSDRGSSRYSGGDRGRSGKLNTHQTANAVNMLVGLTSLLSEMQRKPPGGGGGGSGPERRHSSTGGPGASSSSDRWQTSYSERSRPRSSDYGGSYGSSSSSFRESSSSYRDDWGSSRSESMRSGGGGGSGHGGHSSYDDSYYEDRGARKRTLSDRGGYDDDYYGRGERGGLKRSKMMSRGRGGGPRGRY